MNDVDALTLRILTPEGERPSAACDSVTVVARDGADGEGGGSVGIRKGHLPAVIALEDGSAVKASSDGETVAEYTVTGAFASVRDNVVTVTAETAS